MASLTGIFAPGSSPLVESLRTLEVEPRTDAAPGELVRASFTFSNLGGAPATGVRVRFSHPQGAQHVADADELDGAPLQGQTHLTDANGAEIGTLAPGEQRRVSCSFKVNDTVEDATLLLFQAALVTDQTPLIGTNVARLRVRSTPVLQNASTLATLVAPDDVRPGETLTVRAVIANSGSSSAHDVVAILPVPDFTSYVARSARIDGRLLSGDREPFDYASSTIVAEVLAPGQSVEIDYQVLIDSPLQDGARIRAIGTVASAETPEFGIVSSEVVVRSPGDFEGDETSFTVLSDEVVTPGVRVPLILRAVNTGTGIAQQVTAGFSLPSGLVYAPGSAHVDGQPVSDESVANLTFALGTLGAGRTVEAGITATVVVPEQSDAAMNVEASLRWKGGSRAFSRRLTVRVAPRFTRARNYIEADRGIAQAAEDVTFIAHVYNDGTASDHAVALRAIPGPYLSDLRIAESGGEIMSYQGPLDLGIVEPHAERAFTIVARISDRIPDRSSVTLGAALERANGTVDLGTATVVVRSRPMVARESVAWEVGSHDALRPGGTAEIVVRFTNDGNDMLRDARMSWHLPPDLQIERAVDARRERDGLHFGDVAAKATHEAHITLRLLRAPEQSDLTLYATLLGRGISPLQFPPLTLKTFAQASFESVRVQPSPAENVNAGDRLSYEIRLRNDGDGPANRLIVRVVPTNLAVYMPASTTINGMAIPDDGGRSPLWSGRGLALADVDPGVELRIRWDMVVMSPLTAGTALDTRAVLEWGDQSHAAAAPTVRVQAQPSLGETSEGSAFSIARLFPQVAQPAEPSFEEAPVAAAASVDEPVVPVYETPAFADETSVETVAPAVEPQAAPADHGLPPQIAEMIAAHHEALQSQEEAPEQAVPVLDAQPPAAEVAEAPETPQPGEEFAAEAPPAQPAQLVPVLFADFTPERLDNTIKMLERSDAGGLIQHLFAMRLLSPDSALGAPPQVQAAFASASRAMRAPLERFFVRLRMPRLTVSGKDLEDRDSRTALQTLLDELPFAPAALAARPEAGKIRISGTLDAAAIRPLAETLETAPLGAVAPWAISVALLGDTMTWDSGQAYALSAYRKELQNVFSVLSQLPIDEFHRVLSSSVNRTLDDRLNDVLEALRGAVHAHTE